MTEVILDAQGERAIHDIEARHVYADMLCERNDPQGEFIQLQLLADPSAEQDERATHLFRKHRRTWLGSLAEFVYVGDQLNPLLTVKGERYEEILLRFSQGSLY